MESSCLNNEIFCHDGTNNPSRSTFVDNKEVLVRQLPLHLLGSRYDTLISIHSKSHQEVYEFVVQSISELKAVVLKENSTMLKISAAFQHTIAGKSPIYIDFCVYSHIMNDENLSVLYMECIDGDLFEYNKLFCLFKEIIGPSLPVSELMDDSYAQSPQELFEEMDDWFDRISKMPSSESMDDSIIAPTTNNWKPLPVEFFDFGNNTIVSSLPPQELSEKVRDWSDNVSDRISKMSGSESMNDSKIVATAKKIWKIELLP